MGKKSKKKKKKGTEKNLPLDLVENRARRALEAGRFRQAKDDYKELCKHDRDKYLPHLVEAYEKLALQMIEKGQIKEAESLTELIEKTTGAPASQSLKMRMATAREEFESRAVIGFQLIPDKDDRSDGLHLEAADALVLGFVDSPSPGVQAPFNIQAGLTAVHSALEKVSREKYEEALDELGSVGSRSPLAHWRMFIKGLCAFYRQDDEKARKAFERLPGGSVPAKAAQPYLCLIEGGAGFEKYRKEQWVLGQACRIAGRKDYAAVLPRAEYLWQVKRYRDSYSHIRNRFPGFPSDNPGLACTLSSFYLNSVFGMEEKQADKYLSFLIKGAYKGGKKHKIESLMIQRMTALFSEKEGLDDMTVTQLWESFMDDHVRVYGEDRRLRACLYAHLGGLFAAEEPSIHPFFRYAGGRYRHVELRDEELAEEYFEKSLELEPGNKDVHLAHLQLYEKLGNKSRLNRKLDEVVRLFPDDTDALLKAGINCLQRNALQKGLKYLERTVELDPLDMQAREHLVRAYIMNALRHARKRQVSRCRALLTKSLEKGVADADDFNTGHAYLYARWAAFELLTGNGLQAEEMIARAHEACREELKLSYFYELIARTYGVRPDRLADLDQRIQSEFSKTPSAKKAVSFIQVLSYIERLSSFKGFYKELRRVMTYARKAAKYDCDRQDADAIVNFVLSEEDDWTVANKYVEKMLRSDPEDPLFLFHRYQIRAARNPTAVLNRKDLNELRRIRSLAEKRKDSALTALIERAMEELEKILSAFEAFPRYDILPDLDLEDDFDPEEEDFDAFPIPIPGRDRKRRERKAPRAGRQGPGVQQTLFDDF